MAAAMATAKVLRGGRSGFFSSQQPMIPAIFRRSAQEGVAPPLFLQRLGSSPAAPAAGVHVGRLMHTGSGVSTKLPQHGVLAQGKKIVRMEQFSSRRSFRSGSEPRPGPPGDVPWGAIAFVFAIGLGLGTFGHKM